MMKCQCIRETPRGSVLELFYIEEIYPFQDKEEEEEYVRVYTKNMNHWESINAKDFERYFIRL